MPQPAIIITGLSHRSAPVEARERLAVPDGDVPGLLRTLSALPGVDECVLISTCNRVELVLCGEDAGSMRRALLAWLEEERGLSQAWLARHGFSLEGEAAVQHLLRVTASLDSLIVGEPQIVGQIRQAYRISRETGTCGATLGRVFDHALRTAKRVRTETRIAENAVSVSFAAVELARKVFGQLAGRRLLVVGAGKMGVLAVRHLNAAGATEVDIVNRSLSRAAETAAQLGGRAHAMDALPRLLSEVDIVISSTGAQDPVIRREMLAPVIERRRFRPLFLIDIAVPRDIEPACGDLPGVFLFDVDALGSVVEDNLRGRQREASRAESIVAEESAALQRRMAESEIVPTIVGLRELLHRLREEELERLGRVAPQLDEPTRKAVEVMTRRLINKVLHVPMTALREANQREAGTELVESVQQLFRLDGTSSGEEDASDEELDWSPGKEKLH